MSTKFYPGQTDYIFQLNAMDDQFSTMSNNYYNSAVSALAYANAAAASSTAASSAASAATAASAAINVTANVSAWSAATNYSVGTVIYSTTNYQNYRRKVAGITATDPSLDYVNWEGVGFGPADIGTKPNQVPLNQYLGSMAFQSKEGIVIRPQASVAPTTVGDMVFQLTSNTSLVVKVMGTDGVIRAATLTLA